jgi:lipopolysaccharide transport system permease protein
MKFRFASGKKNSAQRMSQQNNEEEEWSLVIDQSNAFFDLKLNDVWRYRDLLFLFVKRDFVSFYKQTILGPVWFFIQPLITTITFTFIFGNLAKIDTGATIPKPLFYMAGIVTWGYFAECLTKTSTVFKDNAGIFGKVYFPRLIMPLSIVMSNLLKFGVQLLLFIVVLLYYVVVQDYQPNISAYALLLPLMIVIMAGLGLGLGMIISAATTKYRDLAFLIGFGVQLFMYASPVIYPLQTLPEGAREIMKWNPMAPVIEGIRFGFFGEGMFSWGYLAYSLGITIFILLIGAEIFNRVEKKFVDTV